MKLQLAGIIGLWMMATCGSVWAQGDVPEKVVYPKWDVGTTFGFVVPARREFDGSGTYGSNDPSWNWNLDFGRFLTTHIKADAGLMTTTPRSYYDYVFAAPNSAPVTYTIRKVRPTAASAGGTYQFFENTFVHPYVTAGVRFNILQEQRDTYQISNYPPASQAGSSQTHLELRPFAAVGVKSYFNERWFMRSEVMLAADRHGISHGTARIGIGFDF